jgi:hypothetical protein
MLRPEHSLVIFADEFIADGGKRQGNAQNKSGAQCVEAALERAALSQIH